MTLIDENSTEDNYYKENGDAIMQYLSKLQYYKVYNQRGFFVMKKYLKHTPNRSFNQVLPNTGAYSNKEHSHLCTGCRLIRMGRKIQVGT